MKKIGLTGWIILGMVCGIAAGLLAPEAARGLTPLSNIFLRAVKAVMAPLIFGALISAIAGTGDLKATGRLGAKTVVYFWGVTTLALACGMLTALALRPGLGVTLPAGRAGDLPAASMGAGASQPRDSRMSRARWAATDRGWSRRRRTSVNRAEGSSPVRRCHWAVSSN
ncbi:MAG TPA: hypothetical protein DEB06_11045 [Phycisphaerales bacterium]|nr:hypothetical protein [Phycisphaerales bacterium]